MSFNNFVQKGAVKNLNGYNRQTARANIDQTIGTNLTASLQMGFTRSQQYPGQLRLVRSDAKSRGRESARHGLPGPDLLSPGHHVGHRLADDEQQPALLRHGDRWPNRREPVPRLVQHEVQRDRLADVRVADGDGRAQAQHMVAADVGYPLDHGR